MSSNLLTLERIRRLEEIAFRAWLAPKAESHAGWLQASTMATQKERILSMD
jgi:hypothetical protein